MDTSYSHFRDFIERYLHSGFREVHRPDPYILGLEETLKDKQQFFYIGDLINLQFLYTSDKSRQILGVDPENVGPLTFFTATHPHDLARHSLARSKLIRMGHDLFIQAGGESYISTCFRTVREDKSDFDLLYQGYMFYSEIPYRTVFLLMVLTDVTRMGVRKLGYHYYVGSDPSFFRFPDKKLLQTGLVFSDREFEIIKLLSNGLTSEQIAKKIFLSVNTINTHRRNILVKSGKSNTSELILDLKEMGVI